MVTTGVSRIRPTILEVVPPQMIFAPSALMNSRTINSSSSGYSGGPYIRFTGSSAGTRMTMAVTSSVGFPP